MGYWSFERLLEVYAAGGRHYHNVQHLWDLWQFYEVYAADLQFGDWVLGAIWFHDWVYRPSFDLNEWYSARVMVARLGRRVGAEGLAMMRAYVLATRRHEWSEDLGADGAYFLDFDLGVLARPWEDYCKYVGALEREYAPFVSWEMFQRGRIGFLRSFLARKTLYFSAEFRRTREDLARFCLERELDWRERGLWPSDVERWAALRPRPEGAERTASRET